MFIIVILLIMGCIGAVVAGNKGRNQLGWFILCFLFALIGLIVLLILPNLKQEHLNNTKQCPKCAERVLNEAAICKHCSFDFAAKFIQ